MFLPFSLTQCCCTHLTSDLNNCNFVDADAADLPACFDSFGKTDIEML